MATKNTKTTENSKVESTDVTLVEEKKNFTAEEIDINRYIVVRNGFQGRLVYISKKTGEKYVWENFGDEQEIELKELRNAKNSNKKFFINNWLMFDDDWVVDYLGVGQYYKNSLSINSFDEVFKKSPSEIKKIIDKLSDGQKRSLAYRARTLIYDKEIDSNKVISALEEGLGVELVVK